MGEYVPKDPSNLQQGGYIKIPIDSTHICRPDIDPDRGYTPTELADLYTTLQSLVDASLSLEATVKAYRAGDASKETVRSDFEAWEKAWTDEATAVKDFESLKDGVWRDLVNALLEKGSEEDYKSIAEGVSSFGRSLGQRAVYEWLGRRSSETK